ncbi:Nn.00g047360.m01.CDS01 [Neocucurbitaria sp. VM-36]
MLDYCQNELISGARKDYFEDLRQRVPRFLFRAWSKRSGGGPELATNSSTEIIPHAFKNGAPLHGFYDVPERRLFEIVYTHYYDDKNPVAPLSEFSSWTAFLHLVLWYAHRIPEAYDPHIAVMDRCQLEEQDTLVWHVPDLLADGEVHEYLAHGCIRGVRGYTAVPLQMLKSKGLFDVFPELAGSEEGDDIWGVGQRKKMFDCPPKFIEPTELTVMKNISALFGDLGLPVAVALMCLRSRPWESLLQDDDDVVRQLPSQVDIAQVSEISVGKSIPIGLGTEVWLRPGAVITRGRDYDFPDVRQWIGLLRAFCEQGSIASAGAGET